MAEPYLTNIRDLVDRLSLHDSGDASLTCKHFFSGAVVYVGEQIFMSLSPVGLALKLSAKDCETLFADGARPLKYFAKSPIKKGYVVLPEHLATDDNNLRPWIFRSLDHVASQPF